MSNTSCNNTVRSNSHYELDQDLATKKMAKSKVSIASFIASLITVQLYIDLARRHKELYTLIVVESLITGTTHQYMGYNIIIMCMFMQA